MQQHLALHQLKMQLELNPKMQQHLDLFKMPPPLYRNKMLRHLELPPGQTLRRQKHINRKVPINLTECLINSEIQIQHSFLMQLSAAQTATSQGLLPASAGASAASSLVASGATQSAAAAAQPPQLPPTAGRELHRAATAAQRAAASSADW